MNSIATITFTNIDSTMTSTTGSDMTGFQEVSIVCRGGEVIWAPRQLLEEESDFIRQVFSSSTCAPVIVFPDFSVEQCRCLMDYLVTGNNMYEYLLPYTAKLYTFVNAPDGRLSASSYFAVTFLAKRHKEKTPYDKLSVSDVMTSIFRSGELQLQNNK